MFNKDFYPTPEDVANQMLRPYYDEIARNKVSILEPSSGKGDLINAIEDFMNRAQRHNYQDRSASKIYAFEKNPELYMLSSQNEKVTMLGYDFLEYKGGHYFNFIVMNPPFSEGEKHLLHAFEILHEGHIVCLLNAESIRNPYNDDRKRMKHLIEMQGGTVEFLGNCFKNAERSTNVDVAVVRLHKKAAFDPFSFDKIAFNEGKAVNLDFSANGNELANRDIVGNMEKALEMFKEKAISFVKSACELGHYSGMLGFRFDSTIFGKMDATGYYNYIISLANNSAWNSVFKQLDFMKGKTEKVQRDFQKFRSANEHIIFTKQNVWNVLSFLLENQDQILQQAFVDMFDRLTKYSPKNIIPNERWKTNSHYKVNRKVIMPNCGKVVHYSGGYKAFDLYYSGSDFATWSDDLDKLCCHIEGVSYSSIQDETVFRTVQKSNPRDLSKFPKEPLFSRFFKIRIYMKGTTHLEFLNEETWAKFNQIAAKGKNWLG